MCLAWANYELFPSLRTAAPPPPSCKVSSLSGPALARLAGGGGGRAGQMTDEWLFDTSPLFAPSLPFPSPLLLLSFPSNKLSRSIFLHSDALGVGREVRARPVVRALRHFDEALHFSRNETSCQNKFIHGDAKTLLHQY